MQRPLEVECGWAENKTGNTNKKKLERRVLFIERNYVRISVGFQSVRSSGW
jgi:hypothetical protein